MKQSPQNTMLNSLEIRRTSLQSSIEVSMSVWHTLNFLRMRVGSSFILWKYLSIFLYIALRALFDSTA